MVEVYVDGASSGNPGPSGIGVYIKDIDYEYKEHIGEATNNVAEATALLRALEIIDKRFTGKVGEPLVIYTDSQLIHGHLTKHWACNSPGLQAIYGKIIKFDGKVNYKLELITSKLNLADGLAKSASKELKTIAVVAPGKDRLPEHETPMAYSPTDDSGKLDREPTTDATEESHWKEVLEKGKPIKPYYRLHHDLVFRSVIVHKYPVDKYGKPLEMGDPEEVARMSEEAVIQLIVRTDKDQLWIG